MKKQFAIAVTILAATAVLGGCASPNYYAPPASQYYPSATQPYQSPQPYQNYQNPQPYPSAQQTHSRYGVVNSIQTVQTNDRAGNGSGMGAGAVLGGVVGGLLGNQVGGGRGRAVATAAGAIGGVLVGNEMEQRNSVQVRNMYQISILLDDGTHQTITQDSVSDLRVGNRVRIEGEQVYRY